MLYNSSKLLVKSVVNDRRERITVKLFRTFPAHTLEILLGAFHFRGICTLGNRTNLFNPVRNKISISYNNFICLLRCEVVKLLKHLISSTEKQFALSSEIRKFHSGKKNLTVYLIFFIHKMRITCRNNRFSGFFSKLNNSSVNVPQSFVVCNSSFVDQITVVAKRHYLQIIKKFANIK